MKNNKNIDEFYMSKAIAQAKLAAKKNEIPVGAVITAPDGKIIARAYNKVENNNCQTGHAEVLAIQKACKKIGDWRLNGYSIYVTLEPCLMCAGLIRLSRLEKVVFGANSPIFGTGSLTNNTNLVHNYLKKLNIQNGIREKDCANLLKSFFRKKRNLS
jgi:tRNA(adenine34) deaminase